MEKINLEQHELIENAQNRIKQKKRLYFHFVVFVVAGIFMYITNKILHFYEEHDWYVWVLILWGFFFVLHFINVFITNKFLGREWERKQREKLVALQKDKIADIKRELEQKTSIYESKKNQNPE
ncbi:2TM domain-containing protein [Abyssalbus ytuae]|uniref:2TM domain-containing protein n=1 Tax=Abyssalbus ytuae TaxID=2926907 RepID=A0A9E6ZMZ3_9FLAO|nr:2TM domain-containing protein [Abyssalbus ytuae]UOB18869.1 2TM domain-containing protein [Abyssalbus ytuae]